MSAIDRQTAIQGNNQQTQTNHVEWDSVDLDVGDDDNQDPPQGENDAIDPEENF